MENILEANNIEKKYGHFKALNNLNMHIPKGAIYGLIGKNGAGKTTLIRLICGLQKVTSGEYTIFGISNNSRRIVETRKRVGGMVETPSICTDMTAEDNLKEQYKIIGLPSYDNLQEILKLVRLNNTGKKKAKHFSLGMKQRLGLAIALVGNPDLLILDEPINGLDPEGIIEIRELILKLNKEKGITFLISSHYLDELSKIATFYGIIDKGKIIKEIDKNELEQNFRKRTQITVTNIKECVKYLEEKELAYKVVSDDTIDIYEKENAKEVAQNISENEKEKVESESEENEETVSTENTEEQNGETERMLQVKQLQEQNVDIIGWLEIENTNINYPVLQGTDNSYYMTHNYKKENSKNGSIFLDANYNWNIPNNNLLIYGHNLGNGMMFQELLKYEKESFYQEHPVIRFTTAEEDAKYDIISAFKSRVYHKSEKNVFRYYFFLNSESEEEYKEFVKNAKNASLYPIDATANYGDQLITLSTCSYYVQDGRFAVVGRRQ